ncbi:MAG: prepilin-type N-terminal cleavage/methylation domain-containing protein [Actinomycetota bacterium]|nr:prepilin-type N-terminal cleavage/methylation domain-containing protein [Actinomycetota bacterium]
MTRFRRFRLKRDQRGYTLVEMLMVMVILGIVMNGVTVLFISATRAEVDMNSRFQAQQAARVALDKVRREVHCADAATPAGASSSVTLTLPSYCKTYSGSASVTWCTRIVSTGRYGLYRVNGATCVGGVKWADYLTLSSTFNFTAQTTTSLAKLHVDFPVNVTPNRSTNAYELVDDIVLRNTKRS